jgi:DNA-binding NarL/FixJ family response regulator
MGALRVLIADDHALARAGLRLLLECLPDVHVVGEAGDGHEGLRLIAERRPDLALVDVSMPRLNGIEMTIRAAKAYPRLRVLVLSMHADEEYVRQALRAGAAGYLLKNADRHELELAVRAAARGDTWLSPGISRSIAAAFVRAEQPGAGPFQRLTARQREILQLIAEGHSTKDIAHHLGVSVKTVETHRAQLMERLGVRGVPGLVRYAISVGLVQASF